MNDPAEGVHPTYTAASAIGNDVGHGLFRVAGSC